MMKLSERMKQYAIVPEHDTQNEIVLQWADEVAKLEEENVTLKRLVTEQELTLESYRIKLDRLEQEIIPAMENEHAALKRENDVLRNTVSLLKNENERLTKLLEEQDEEVERENR